VPFQQWQEESCAPTLEQPPHDARAALLATAPARAASKRKREGDESDDDAEVEVLDAPPIAPASAASSRPRRTASLLASAHSAPLLQRRAQLLQMDGEEGSDEEDEDWRDAQEEKEERKEERKEMTKRAPVKRKSVTKRASRPAISVSAASFTAAAQPTAAASAASAVACIFLETHFLFRHRSLSFGSQQISSYSNLSQVMIGRWCLLLTGFLPQQPKLSDSVPRRG